MMLMHDGMRIWGSWTHNIYQLHHNTSLSRESLLVEIRIYAYGPSTAGETLVNLDFCAPSKIAEWCSLERHT